jgi:hypothetical protein
MGILRRRAAPRRLSWRSFGKRKPERAPFFALDAENAGDWPALRYFAFFFCDCFCGM